MSINQGDVWEGEFFPNVGSEIGKQRSAIVISNDLIGKLPLKTLVPLTHWSASFEHYPWMLKFEPNDTNGLLKPSGADCFQVRNFSHEHFKKRLGSISESELLQIHESVAKTLNPKYALVQ